MNSPANDSTTKTLENGYDLPVYGLDNGSFYYIHIPALFCIFCSFCCVVAVLILSFRRKSFRTFFSWTKSERFIVYLAICDGGYNIFHSVDHLHYVIAKDHVRPKQLCELYAFTLAECIMGQNLMVNIVAINAFMLMFFEKNLNFGTRDWKLLLWTFGLPFAGATLAAILGQLGPNGSFCYFDGVKGDIAFLCFTTIPLLIIIVLNSVMYALTWWRIRQQERLSSIKRKSQTNAQRAAGTMSMFVVAFFIQWWSLAVFGVWVKVDPDVPQVIHHFVTTFTNLGGCLNLGVYAIMRWRNKTADEASESRKLDSSVMKNKSTDSGNVTATDQSSTDI